MQLVRLLPAIGSKRKRARGNVKGLAAVVADMLNLVWRQFGLAVMLKFSPEDFVEEYFMERIHMRGNKVEDYTLDCEAIRILWLSNVRQLKRMELLGNKESCWHYLHDNGVRTTGRLGTLVPAQGDLAWQRPDGTTGCLENLFEQHPLVFVKPADGCKGQLCNRLSRTECGGYALGSRELAREELLELVNRPLLVEEVVVNHEEVARFHPGSLNTIRFITMRDENGGIYLEKAIFRMGVGEMDVDNLSLGGIGVEVLPDGTLAEWGHYFDACTPSSTEHPDSHIAFSGVGMPFYRECVDMSLQVHRMNPKLNRIGFDIAVTPDGPVLVEINPFSQTFQAWKGGVRKMLHTRYLEQALNASKMTGEIL